MELKDLVASLSEEEWQTFLDRLFSFVPLPTCLQLLENKDTPPSLRLRAFFRLIDLLRELYSNVPIRNLKDAEFALEMGTVRVLPEPIRSRLDKLIMPDVLVASVWSNHPDRDELVRSAAEQIAGEPVSAHEVWFAIAPDLKHELHRQRRIDANPSGTGRTREHEIAESQLDLPEDAPSPLEIAPSREPEPAEVVTDRDAVERLLSQFGRRTADLLRLMVFEGKTAAEAARELGISPSTARTLVERARKQFSRNP